MIQSKCKQSKAEANTVQNTLQKEITSLRDTNRTIQLKLRDIEVANDDFERQARNTTSSLEDLESKYNVAIERGVMLEEEIRAGEQEREALRIETQRLRDELSDLRIEAEIMQDKLRRSETTTERKHMRKVTPISHEVPRPQSSISERTPETTASSPTIPTPPAKSASSAASDTPTPPSPPVSEKSLQTLAVTTAQPLPKSRLSINNSNVTPRPTRISSRAPRESRGPSVPSTPALSTPLAHRRTTFNRPESRQSHQATPRLAPSASLTQIRGLIGKMQKLEQRVHSVRSKLPAPTATPPRASPRPGSAMGHNNIPGSITLRGQRKRTGGSIASGASSALSTNESALNLAPSNARRVSRLSYGGLPRSPTRDTTNPDLGTRPASRASMASRNSTHHAPSTTTSQMHSSRPSSRQSISNARTAIGHYSASTTVSEARARPRSSMGGSYASSYEHNRSASVSRSSNYDIDEGLDDAEVLTPTPSRRTTVGKEFSGIPTPGASNKRQTGTGIGASGRRASSGVVLGDMGPPLEKKGGVKRLSGVGETY